MNHKYLKEILLYTIVPVAAFVMAYLLCRPADRAIEKYERELKQELQETSIYTQKGGYVKTD